jgi:hypothetical protein
MEVSIYSFYQVLYWLACPTQQVDIVVIKFGCLGRAGSWSFVYPSMPPPKRSAKASMLNGGTTQTNRKQAVLAARFKRA